MGEVRNGRVLATPEHGDEYLMEKFIYLDRLTL